MNENGMLDPKWIKQNRRDCRLTLAAFMGFFEFIILAFTALKLLVQPAGTGISQGWWFIIFLPIGCCLMLELVIIGDNIFLRRHGVKI